MKKKVIIAVVAILALVLFFPVPFQSYDDGGTREFKALTYKIVKWNRMQADDLCYNSTRFYFFPKNLKSVDELWKEIDREPENSPANSDETAAEIYSPVSFNGCFSLKIPQNWVSSEVEVDEQMMYSKEMTFKPIGSEGYMSIQYYPDNLFAVCGTGLECKDITLDSGAKASVGYYDGSADWAFITISEQREYVFVNNGLAGGDALTGLEIAKSVSFSDSFGLSMSFAPDGNRGGKLTFRQSSAIGTPRGELYTGTAYSLEAFYCGEWVSYQEYMQKAFDYDYLQPDFAWTMQAYLIPVDDELVMDIGFTDAYGELEPGRYRICKSVSDSIGTGNSVKKTYYAEFTI